MGEEKVQDIKEIKEERRALLTEKLSSLQTPEGMGEKLRQSRISEMYRILDSCTHLMPNGEIKHHKYPYDCFYINPKFDENVKRWWEYLTWYSARPS